jgi:hypothetical protein
VTRDAAPDDTEVVDGVVRVPDVAADVINGG